MSMTRGEQRRQEEQDATRAIRRRAAVSAATDLFAERGFHAAAMTDIAARAGLSLKALYDGFPSKEALFEAVLAEVGQRFAILLDPTQWSRTRQPRIEAFVDRLVELLAANGSALRLYSRGADGVPAALQEKGADPFAGFLMRLIGLLVDEVRHIQDAGGAQGIDPETAARSILVTIIAEARHRLESGSPVADAAASLKPIVTAMLRAPSARDTPGSGN